MKRSPARRHTFCALVEIEMHIFVTCCWTPVENIIKALVALKSFKVYPLYYNEKYLRTNFKFFLVKNLEDHKLNQLAVQILIDVGYKF